MILRFPSDPAPAADPTCQPELSDLAGELIDLLDEELRLLECRRDQLKRLSAAITDRDDELLEQLLREMEQTIRAQGDTDLRLEALRATLAGALGCSPAELRLSRVVETLDGQQRLALEYRRRRIVLLAEELRREHLQATLVLSESARINRALLEGLFPTSAEITTYARDGAQPWRSDTGLVNEVS